MVLRNTSINNGRHQHRSRNGYSMNEWLQ